MDPVPPERGARPEDLVPALVAGDAEAVARWYRAEHPAVWRLCLGLLVQREEADDAAQDAMLRLLDTLHRYDPRRPYATWRNTVVLNLCRDRLRRIQARRRAEAGAAAELLPALLPDPEQEAAQGELTGIVVRSLGILAPREREAFVLHDLEGESTSAVADALAIAESTVRVLLATARRRLRDLLAPKLPGAPHA